MRGVFPAVFQAEQFCLYLSHIRVLTGGGVRGRRRSRVSLLGKTSGSVWNRVLPALTFWDPSFLFCGDCF